MKLARVKKINAAIKGALDHCVICPRRCGVNRRAGKKGYCRAGSEPVIYSYFPHHGEEPPISGRAGSGTIFFSHCNMKCVYCQNYYFSQLDKGRAVSIDKLASIMLELESAGCHNINLVSPSHYVPQILAALEVALGLGLSLPLVYNTSGYDLPETIKLLEGIVDIYLADMRYSDDHMAKRYSDAADYVKYNRASILEMHRQAGNLTLRNNLAAQGLIIRLLVLPGDISGTIETLKFIRAKLSKNTYLSIMSQYHPTFKAGPSTGLRAGDFKELSRGVYADEYKNVVDEAAFLGLNNGWVQKITDKPDTSFLGTNIKPVER